MATPTAEAIARYERRLALLVRRGASIQRKDFARIRRAFDKFRADTVARLSARGWELPRASSRAALRSVALELDELAAALGVTVRSGLSAQEVLARDMISLYGSAFSLADPSRFAPGVRVTAQALDLAASYSADLVGVRQGGLSAQMLADVNGIVQRAALGLTTDTPFNVITQLQAALSGDSIRKWRSAAEKIYRTETLRIHSLLTEQAIREFNTVTPTNKEWRWSGIERVEHQQINGQQVGPAQKFTVPLREGGSAKMAYPRDPGAPPSAVINCGCYVVPVPRTRTVAPPPPPPPPPRPPRRKRPRSRPLEVAAPEQEATLPTGVTWAGDERPHPDALAAAEALVSSGRVRGVRFGPQITHKTARSLRPQGEWRGVDATRMTLDDETNQIIEIEMELRRLMEAFPKTPRNLPHLTVAQTAGAYGRATVVPKNQAWVIGHRPDTGFAREWKPGSKWKRWSTSTSAAGNAQIRATTRHELAHLLDRTHYGGATQWGYSQTIAGFTHKYSDDFAEALGKAANLRQGFENGLATDPMRFWIESHVGQYAASDAAETFAELFGTMTDRDYVRGTYHEALERFILGPLE